MVASLGLKVNLIQTDGHMSSNGQPNEAIVAYSFLKMIPITRFPSKLIVMRLPVSTT